MATYVHGKGAALAHGGKDITEWINEGTATMVAETGDTTHWGQPGSAKTFILGLQDATFSGSGLYDGSVGGIEKHMEGIIASEQAGNPDIPITFAPEGWAFGNVAIIARAKETSYEVNPVVSDVVSMTFEMQCTGGMSVGSVLMPNTVVAAATVDGSALDNGAVITTTNKGLLVVAHILANTASGTVTVTLQHSTNNSTWVDLVVLPNVLTGTLTAYRTGEVPVGTTINRYLRIRVARAGTGSVTVNASAARK